MENWIEKVINRIVHDIKDRQGIGNEWEQIGDDIKNEIKKEWIKIIEEEAITPRAG